MKNVCYTAVSRDDFIRLYRYGNIKIIKNFIFSENDNLRSNFVSLLKDMHCEHDEDYVILEFLDVPKHNQYGQILYDLKIQDIQQIYVLSQRAQGYYKPKFNPKIQFLIDPYNVLSEVIENMDLEDMVKGVDVFTEEFDFFDKDKIEKELQLDLKRKLLNMGNPFELPFESFYLDLLLYKRKNFFPENDLGFIYDLMVVTRLKDRDGDLLRQYNQGQLKLDNSPTYQKIKKEIKESLYEYTIFLLKTEDPNISKFISIIGSREVVVGIIFLKIQKILLEKNKGYYKIILNVVDIFSNSYRDELAVALYLIGILFGYKELYNDYYDFIDLNIFNVQKANVEKEISCDELKNKIQELEDKLKDYEKKEDQKLLPHKTVLNSNFSENDSVTNPVTLQKYGEVGKIDLNDSDEASENCEENSIQIQNKNILLEDIEPKNKKDIIKEYLSSLDEKMIIIIWSNASNIAQNKLGDTSKEELIEKIIIHESSCSTVKELLQTFQRDTLAHILYWIYKKKKKNNTLKELKTHNKESLVADVLRENAERGLLGESDSCVNYNGY